MRINLERKSKWNELVREIDVVLQNFAKYSLPSGSTDAHRLHHILDQIKPNDLGQGEYGQLRPVASSLAYCIYPVCGAAELLVDKDRAPEIVMPDDDNARGQKLAVDTKMPSQSSGTCGISLPT